MIVKSIELSDFRNYKSCRIDLDCQTNIFYGDNAQGKTNILEALYVSATTKSHKGSRDREMIRFGTEESHIRTVVEKEQEEYQLDIHLKKNSSKGIAVNRIPIRKASELCGILNIVMFSPEDLAIIKNGPAERRRFLDLELCQLDKIYLMELTRYHRILNQRNKLLKDIIYRKDLTDTLSVWDEQLFESGKKIIQTRRNFLQEIGEIVTGIHHTLSGGKEELKVSYEPDTSEDELEKTLLQNRERDIRYGQTSEGPHRDDISFFINQVDIRKYGSQGQQRCGALSLKMAEIELVKKMIHDKPVLLLDDVLSELDSSRQNYLLNSIHDIQTLITCTGLDEFVKNRFSINRVYRVNKGTIEPA